MNELNEKINVIGSSIYLQIAVQLTLLQVGMRQVRRVGRHTDSKHCGPYFDGGNLHASRRFLDDADFISEHGYGENGGIRRLLVQRELW